MDYYKVGLRHLNIEKVEVDKSTAHHVHINGTPIPKEAVDCYYYPTFQEAKDAIVTYYDGLAKGLEMRLRFANEKLEEANKL